MKYEKSTQVFDGLGLAVAPDVTVAGTFVPTGALAGLRLRDLNLRGRESGNHNSMDSSPQGYSD
ncbi:hypothetical protein ACQB6R_05940 [Propionibacteriaceae bacterium G1746]|uniref:hypothetical protein n=1 Tax=Aestuariimicrobium sp. G57 TaxID=3418485 RepID=UPI003C280EA4